MMRLFTAWAIQAIVAVVPGLAMAASVSVDVSSNLSTVADSFYGIHTSVYDNQNGNSSLPGLLIQSGVNALRYPGGGYADVYHWSLNSLSPWADGTYGYVGPQTDFGHFVQLLDNAHAQAVITVNYGSGQQWNSGHTRLVAPGTNGLPEEAAAWVAYANGDASLYGTAGDAAIGTDALGNDWKTVGFWAKLRSSTVAQYKSWAGTAYNASYNFLAINHPAPAAVKYWEIGNETFGTGYYDGSTNGYSVNYASAYDAMSRLGISSLSPAFYGQKVHDFALAMKAVDPTIKIGAVVSTPPGDYAWDSYNGQRWTPEVLAQCASNVDFVIAHWYPYAGDNANGSSLLSQVGSTLPFMLNGLTPGQDANTNSGLRDWINLYRPADGSNVQVFITEFGYNGSLAQTNSGKPVAGPVDALFAADCYSTWAELGVANVDYLEMNKANFLGDSSALVRGAVYYGIQMVHDLAGVGDEIVVARSDSSSLRASAALRQDGKLGLLLIE